MKNHIGEVGSKEAHAEHVLLLESQLHLYVFYHGRRGCGGKCEDGSVGEELAEERNLQIRRTEVVAPLRDAVRLIDGDEADAGVSYLGDEKFGGESFGRDIEQLVGTEDAVLERHQYLVVGHAGIYCRRFDATSPQVLHLVFHQCNERRDNEAQAFRSQCWHLKRYRLSASCRHQAEGVASLSDALDDVELYAAEVVVVPISPQYLAIIIFH